MSKSAVNSIVRAANLSPEETVLEIGPGLGTLTYELARHAKRVVTIEKDPVLAALLMKTSEDTQNIQTITKDALSFDHVAFFGQEPFKLIANLPYYITSPVIRKFLETPKQPELMVLMVQKEVAQRICASPPRMTLLSCAVQFFATVSIVRYVKKELFWPAPRVSSAIILILPHTPSQNPVKFFEVMKAGFLHPRRQLAKNLSDGLSLPKEDTRRWLEKNKIEPKQRAETLSIEQWEHLVDTKP